MGFTSTDLNNIEIIEEINLYWVEHNIEILIFWKINAKLSEVVESPREIANNGLGNCSVCCSSCFLQDSLHEAVSATGVDIHSFIMSDFSNLQRLFISMSSSRHSSYYSHIRIPPAEYFSFFSQN